jgi:[ribosomal protein S5]-alanine N-acetyltransferase
VELTGISALPLRMPDRPVGIETARLLLRSMEASDAQPHYARWMNDPDIVRYTESRYTDHSIDDIRRYIATMRRNPDSLLLAMVTGNGQRHIGNIKIGAVDWHHRSGDIGLLIGETDCWGQGYASEAITALADYAFTTLCLEKLAAGVYAPNTGCVRAFERAGFVCEGVRRNQCRFECGRVDVVLMGRICGEGD